MKAAWLLPLLICVISATAFAGPSEKRKGRIEELFIWKVTDTLGLSTKEEVEFQKLTKHFRDERSARAKQIEEVISKLGNSKGETERGQLLSRYKTLLKEYSAAQLEEVEQIEKLLGADRLARYLVLREELLAKLKLALSDQ